MAASIPASGSVTSQLPPAPGQGCSTSWQGAVAQALALCGAPGYRRKAVAAATECCHPQGQPCPAAALTRLPLCHCHPRSPLKPLVACSCPWGVGPAWFPTLPTPSPSGCSHGNIPDQSPLLSQSCTNQCELQHCSLRALKGLGHQDHAGRARRQARAGSLLQDMPGCRKREWPCFCPPAAPCHCHPCLLCQASKSPRAPPGSNNTGQAGKPSSQAPALQPCSCPAAMPTASTR